MNVDKRNKVIKLNNKTTIAKPQHIQYKAVDNLNPSTKTAKTKSCHMPL
jgi:hypothetical protein